MIRKILSFLWICFNFCMSGAASFLSFEAIKLQYIGWFLIWVFVWILCSAFAGFGLTALFKKGSSK